MNLEDPCYLNIARFETDIAEIIEFIAGYNSTNHENKIEGIHIDVEPHALLPKKESYKDDDYAQSKKVFNSYLELLCLIRTHIKQYDILDKNFMFTASTGWWYELATDFGPTSISYLGRYLDAIVPMAYNSENDPLGANFNKLKEILPVDLWTRKATMNSGFIIGLAMFEYESLKELVSTIQKLEEWLLSEFPKYFKGVAIYSDMELLES